MPWRAGEVGRGRIHGWRLAERGPEVRGGRGARGRGGSAELRSASSSAFPGVCRTCWGEAGLFVASPSGSRWLPVTPPEPRGENGEVGAGGQVPMPQSGDRFVREGLGGGGWGRGRVGVAATDTRSSGDLWVRVTWFPRPRRSVGTDSRRWRRSQRWGPDRRSAGAADVPESRRRPRARWAFGTGADGS